MTRNNDDAQVTFGTDGDLDKPDSIESDLEKFGVESERPAKKKSLDRPEPDVFGDGSTQIENEPDAGEQAGLCREIDEDQKQLDGDEGAETPAGWE